MSMLRNVLTYMGLGPDEDYGDAYSYEPSDHGDDEEHRERRTAAKRRSRADAAIDLTTDRQTKAHDHRERRPPSGRPESVQRDRGRAGGEPARSVTRATSTAGADSRSASSTATGRDREQRGEDESTLPPRRRGRHDITDPMSDRPLRAVPPAELGNAGDGITIRSVPPPPEPTYAKPRPLSPRSFGDAKTLADEFKSAVPVIMNLQGVERDLARRLIDFASGVCYALDGSMEKIAPQVFLLTPQSVEVKDEHRRLPPVDGDDS